MSNEDEKKDEKYEVDVYFDYRYIDNFELLDTTTDLNATHVRLLCKRPLYHFLLSDRPGMWERYIKNIRHYKNDRWSTHWLDIVFNTKCGEHKESNNHKILGLIPQNFFRLRHINAVPSKYFKGYFNLSNDWYALYFLCTVTDVINPDIKASFLVPLTQKERQCLHQRIRYNRRYETTNWLIKKWI
jgi:hypothetical protein